MIHFLPDLYEKKLSRYNYIVTTNFVTTNGTPRNNGPEVLKKGGTLRKFKNSQICKMEY